MTAQLIREAMAKTNTGLIPLSAMICIDDSLIIQTLLPRNRDEADAINDAARLIIAKVNARP